MKKPIHNNAFILTSDEPISAVTFKRLLLTHNKVYFSDISDEAIVNEKEVIESFDRMKVAWTACGHYPRVTKYNEKYTRALEGSGAALNRQLLRPIKSHDIKSVDPGIHWMCYNASLSNKTLVEAASIDASAQKPDLPLPNTILGGLEIAPSGMKSKYSVDFKDPTDIPGIHKDWNWICRLRVGRALKSIRLAQALGASPIAIDNINSEISLALMKQNSPLSFNNDSIMDFVIDMNIVDIEKLEEVLSTVSWRDVLKLRKEILPIVSKTKKILEERTNKISRFNYPNPEEYLCALRELKKEFEDIKTIESEAWESLRIGSILKIGGVAGTIGIGSIAMPSFNSLHDIIIALISTGLLTAATLNQELKKLIPARRKVREHPLFLIEKLENKK